MYIYSETKRAIVLSVLITAVLSVGATLAWQKSVDTTSVLRWTDEAANFFPMGNPANFAGVDTLGMNLQKVRVHAYAGGSPVEVDYVGDRGIHGHGRAAMLSEAVKAAAENYRQLQKERGK